MMRNSYDEKMETENDLVSSFEKGGGRGEYIIFKNLFFFFNYRSIVMICVQK